MQLEKEVSKQQDVRDFSGLPKINQHLFRVVALARPLFGDGIDELWLESVPHRIPVRMELTNGPELNVKCGDYLSVAYRGVQSELPPDCIRGSDITAIYTNSCQKGFGYTPYTIQTIHVDGNPIHKN